MSFTLESAARFGRDLQRWRKEQGLTQEDLGRIGQVSQGQVSRILDGGAREVTAAVRRLAKAAALDLTPLRGTGDTSTLRAKLYAELELCWDGSKPQAETLIALLRAARSLSVKTGSRLKTENGAGKSRC